MREVLVDTNILLRYLTNEPAELAQRAFTLMEAAERIAVPLVVTPIALAESRDLSAVMSFDNDFQRIVGLTVIHHAYQLLGV